MILAALGFALCGSVLAYSRYFADPYSLPKFSAAALGAAAAWTAIALRRKSISIGRTPLDYPLAALLSLMCLSAFASLSPEASVIGQYGSYAHGILPLLICAAVFYAAVDIRLETKFKTLSVWLIAAGALSAAYGIWRAPWGSRVIGASGSPVYLGACLLMLCPPALSLTLSGNKTEKWIGRIGGFLILSGLVLTLSRSAYLGAVAGTGLYLALSKRISGKNMFKLAGIAAGTGALTAFLFFAAAAIRPRSSADSARVQTWVTAAKIFTHYPLLGAGPDAFMPAFRLHRSERTVRILGARHGQNSAHNDVLQAASTLGILGLGAYLWLLLSLFVSARRSLAEHSEREARAAAAGALAGLFLQTKFNPAPLTALLIASAFAAVLIAPAGKKSLLPKSAYAPAAWAAAVLCAAVFLMTARFLSADHMLRRAQSFDRYDPGSAAPPFESALALHPWELTHRGAYHRFLIRWASNSASARQSVMMLERALHISAEGIRRHPNRAGALHMHGLSLYALNRAGGKASLEDAELYLERAQKLDPYFMPTRLLRKLVAEARRDQDKASRISQEIRALEKNLPRR